MAFCATTIGSILSPVDKTDIRLVILSRETGSFAPSLFKTIIDDTLTPTCSLSLFV